MIGRSRLQRRSALSVGEGFRLHLRIAARATLSRRLLRGSLGALLGSVVTVALRWPLWEQAAALALGFLLGALLPVPGERRRALAYLRTRAGLSYETALEVDARADGPAEDPYGLLPAVRQRALDSIRDVRVPDAPAWWLPFLAAALALLLLPLTSPGAFRGPGAGAPTPSEAPTPAQAADAQQPESGTAPPLPQAAPDRVQQPGPTDAPPDANDNQGQEARAPAGGTGDELTLSRYMETLRQRPSDSAGPESGTPPENLRPRDGSGQPDSASGDPRQPGQGDSRPGDGQDGRSAESGAGQDPQNGGSGASSGQGQGDGASQDAGQNADAGGQGDSGNGDGTEQGGLGANGGEGSQQPQSGQGNAGTLPDERGPNGSSEAGNAAGPATPAGPGVSGPTAPPSFLEGQLREGPQNPGGAVRLPGSQDVTLPAGTSVEGYRKAAEQALTEGDLPLEYQDIIRRYFR